MSNSVSLFKEYATGCAFSLHLSKKQVEMVKDLYEFQSTHGEVRTFDALVSKGIAERYDYAIGDEDTIRHVRRVRLTEAGMAVANLLALAGLVNSPQAVGSSVKATARVHSPARAQGKAPPAPPPPPSPLSPQIKDHM